MRKKVGEGQKRPLTNLKKYRKDNGISQQEIADALHIGQDTVSSYETGATLMPSEHIYELSKKLGVSADYILGLSEYLNIGNEEIVEMTGLDEEAVETLREYKEAYTYDLITADTVSGYGISYTPHNPIKTLCTLINSPAFEPLLNAIEDYIHPRYDKPMFFVAAGEEVGGSRAQRADYHIPKNQIHKKPRHDQKGNVVYDNYLPLVKDEENPSDYRAIPINRSVLDSASLLQIQRCLDEVRDYNNNR